jgi:hypothetical protein
LEWPTQTTTLGDKGLLATAATQSMQQPTAAHGAGCWPGTLPGGWHRYEWLLRNSSWPSNASSADVGPSSSCAPLRRFVHADVTLCGRKVVSSVPGATPTNLPSCSARDQPLLQSTLSNASILMVGDSTSAQLLMHACETFSLRPRSFVPVDAKALKINLGAYRHRLRSLDNHVCNLPGGVVLGSFSHYGVAGPPYWVFAYPLAPWLANSTAGMARKDMPKFRAHTPNAADPTLIVASSGFWDIAAWWAHEANFSKRWRSTSNHTARYVAGVRKLVRETRRAFPRSVVAWRLMHPGAKHSITPRIVKEVRCAPSSPEPSPSP